MRINHESSSAIFFISKFGLLCFCCFIIFVFLGRILFPYGDEPDFSVRAYNLLVEDHPVWSPYYWFSLIMQRADLTAVCNIDAQPLSLWAKIYGDCREPVWQYFARVGVTIIVSLLVFIPVIFRGDFFSKFIFREEKSIVNGKLNALALAMISPGVIYYSGVIALEQLVLILSFLVFLLTKNILLSVCLVLLIISIDLGNGLVVGALVVSLFFSNLFFKKNKIKKIIFSVFLVVAFFYFISYFFLEYFQRFGLFVEKSDAIYASMISENSVVDKYPKILRPVVTYMTWVFHTANYVKVVPLYIIFGISILIMLKKIFSYEKHLASSSLSALEKITIFNNFSVSRLNAIVCFGLILSFVFMLPNYSNAKYYIFIMPFFVSLASFVFSLNRIFIFFIFSNMIVFLFLLMYKL